MRVFVTGGTGFVGSRVIRKLLEENHQVIALCREGSEEKLVRDQRVAPHLGDISDLSSLVAGVTGCEAVIHLIGIIREFPGRGVTFRKLHTEATRTMVAAARQAGVKRYLQMSANGTRAGATNPYHRTKWEAEEAVRSSDLEWTIFRPSLIHGAGDQFVNMLATMIRRLPVVPVLGDGRYRMSPVAVDDVAGSFAAALVRPETIGQTYHCGGPQSLSYNEILDQVGKALGKTGVPKLHHPLFLMKPVIAVFESFPQFPITGDQLAMLLEGNEVDPIPWAAAFEFEPRPFFDAIREYLHPAS